MSRNFLLIDPEERADVLHGLASPRDADDIALGITALIDGLWLRLGLQPGSVSREQAILQVKNYVAGRLATREPVTVGA